MNIKTEPVALAAAVKAVLVVGVAFGAGLTAEQLAAVVVAVEVIAGLFVRSRVSPTP